MICNFCGHEVDDKVAECPYCHYIFDKDAQVLSREERDTFDGVTIDEEGNTEDSSKQRAPGYTYEDGYRRERQEQQYQQQNPNIKVYPLGCGSSMLMTLLILGGILALFFFLLPTFLVFAAIGAVVVFFLRLFM